ncbi:MAG: acetyl-CoA C-acyltransferase [Pelagibacterales bacterium]|nr:acetyl-CoA C-acyltransferase [Pelagibacterales bacterium]OUU62120.1 MAG: acetyl-CoA acetyltransferase [Alphaproteobacteria bacterium TMED62]|tara:strand:- start:4297 stop:5484 length:1188 start_codon:yes stop_codon:yes gene_type:complete
MSDDKVVIVSAKRTPIGSFQGQFETIKATELGSRVIAKNISEISINPQDINETIMGCVLPAGLGQAPARQAAIGAGIPNKSGATTINKMCGSGMKSIMFAHDSIKAKQNNIVVAGGLENMTNAPYILSKARKGFRMGHADVKDHMFLDGLEDAYEEGKLMGSFAEDTAEHYQFTREQQDAFAINSLNRARKANDDGTFENEIVPIKVLNKKNEILINKDEQPFKSDITKIPSLKPAFRKNGTVTAANSSSISDGASSVILMLESEADKRGIKPLARIINHSTNSHEPRWFTTAPIGAIEKVLEKSGWKKSDVDLFEVNEAFAVVPMAVIKDIGISDDILNIYGGACALGHPVGASGARIVTTLINALIKNNLKKGVASLCIGGGEATAITLEVVN